MSEGEVMFGFYAGGTIREGEGGGRGLGGFRL